MNEQPLVSVGIPVYNGEDCVRDALDSVLAQSYRTIEIVLCDNASTDRTAAICAEYAARDPRVRYSRNDSNIGARGPLGNIRRVFNLSCGEYYTLTGADDVRPPQVVEEALEVFRRNPRAVMVHGPIWVRLRDRVEPIEIANRIDLTDPDPAARIRAFTKGIQHPAMVYGVFRRDTLRRATLGSHYGDDYLVCLKACLLGVVESIQTPLLVYHQRFWPADNPMYPPAAIALADLLFHRGVRRSKCWVTLVMGCYYLLEDRVVPLPDRLRGTWAHISGFVSRYRRNLGRELLFMVCTPAGWVVSPLLPVAIKLKSALRGAEA